MFRKRGNGKLMLPYSQTAAVIGYVYRRKYRSLMNSMSSAGALQQAVAGCVYYSALSRDDQ